MNIERSIVGAFLNWLIRVLRGLRDEYLGYDRQYTEIPTNAKTKKKWDKWLGKKIKPSRKES